MAQYRKKPVIIEAVQYTEYGQSVNGLCNSVSCREMYETEPHVHSIHNGEVVNVKVGDWIILEPDGVHYTLCGPGIFAESYELV